jgi:hypothetical protein
VLKQGLSKQTCVGRARARAPPEATFTRRRPPSQVVQLPRPPAPRDAQESTSRAVPAGRAPLGPAVRPRSPPSCTVLRLGHHTVVTVGRAVPYLSARPSSSRHPTPRSPLYRARHCRPPVNSPLHDSPVFSDCPKLLPRFTRSLCRHPLLGIAPSSLEPQPAAAATAGHCHAPAPAAPPPQLRSSPGPR